MSISITIIGNLGNFEQRQISKSGSEELSHVLNFSVASSAYRKKEDGTYEDLGTEWVECQYWSQRVPHLFALLKKGMPLHVVGEEKIETYVNKEGVQVKSRRCRVQNIYLDLSNKRVESVSLRQSENAWQHAEAGQHSGE